MPANKVFINSAAGNDHSYWIDISRWHHWIATNIPAARFNIKWNSGSEFNTCIEFEQGEDATLFVLKAPEYPPSPFANFKISV